MSKELNAHFEQIKLCLMYAREARSLGFPESSEAWLDCACDACDAVDLLISSEEK